MTRLAHLNIEANQVAPAVLLPGDPARVDVIGQSLTEFTILGQQREFRIGVGTYQGLPVTVCSTGIGGPSTAIAVEELISAGARVLIRVGTCGGAWRADIAAGSLVIPTASVRDEGTTLEYAPLGFPAVADSDVVTALTAAAATAGVTAYRGINRSHDAFYGRLPAITRWAGLPIISSDMETAALLVIASIRGARAGAVLAVNADPEPLADRVAGKALPVITESNPDITKMTVASATTVALEALHHLCPPL